MSAFHKNGWITGKKRIAIYFRDNFTCACCNRQFTRDNLTLDHICAVSKGGNNHESNLITMCRSCNSSKGTIDLDQFVSHDRYVAIIDHTHSATLDIKSAAIWYNANKMPCSLNNRSK